MADAKTDRLFEQGVTVKKAQLIKSILLWSFCVFFASCLDTEKLATASLASIFEAQPKAEKDSIQETAIKGVFFRRYESKDAVGIELYRRASSRDQYPATFGGRTYSGAFELELDHQAFLAILLDYLLGKGLNPVFVDHFDGGRIISRHPERYSRTIVYLDPLGSNVTFETSRYLDANPETQKIDVLPPRTFVSSTFFKIKGVDFGTPLDSLLRQRQAENWSANLDELVLAWHSEGALKQSFEEKWFKKALNIEKETMEALGAILKAERESHRITGDMLASAIAESAKSMARNAAAGGFADLNQAGRGSSNPGSGSASSGIPSGGASGSSSLALKARSLKTASDGIAYASYFDKRGANMVSPVYIAYGPGKAYGDYESAYAEAKRQYGLLLEIRKKKFEEATSFKEASSKPGSGDSNSVFTR